MLSSKIHSVDRITQTCFKQLKNFEELKEKTMLRYSILQRTCRISSRKENCANTSSKIESNLTESGTDEIFGNSHPQIVLSPKESFKSFLETILLRKL